MLCLTHTVLEKDLTFKNLHFHFKFLIFLGDPPQKILASWAHSGVARSMSLYGSAARQHTVQEGPPWRPCGSGMGLPQSPMHFLSM